MHSHRQIVFLPIPALQADTLVKFLTKDFDCITRDLAERLVEEMRSGVAYDTHPSELNSKQIVRLHELLHAARFPDPKCAQKGSVLVRTVCTKGKCAQRALNIAGTLVSSKGQNLCILFSGSKEHSHAMLQDSTSKHAQPLTVLLPESFLLTSMSTFSMRTTAHTYFNVRLQRVHNPSQGSHLSPAGEYNLRLGVMKELRPELIATYQACNCGRPAAWVEEAVA
eukprot:scaffold48337_cov19-Tisochrysis_lutea.AAC.1